MFFRNVVQRKLLSLLQPWLQEQPYLELKLGFGSFTAIAENLHFDTSALNQLIDDSASFFLTEVTVEYLSVRLSVWSAPALSIEVRGLHVTLSPREIGEEGSLRTVKNSRHRTSGDFGRTLSELDPEGCALHEVLEGILKTTSSKNQLKTSFLNLILKHCRLRIVSVNLQLKLPILNDSIVILLEIKVLNAESEDSEDKSLLVGLVGALFLPLRENSFVINGSGFEMGYEKNDHMNLACISHDLFTCIKLNDLRLVDLNLRIPELSFLFSPADVPVLIALRKPLSRESKQARSGRQLWRVAAGRLGYVLSAPRLSLQNLVGVVILWLRYVNAYQHLLSLVGYYSDKLLKTSAVKMSRDKMLLTSVRCNWKVISKLEKELPAEAIAQARRIARYRATLEVQRAENSYRNSFICIYFQIFCKIISLLGCISKVMYRVFQSIVHFFSLRKTLIQEPEVDMNVEVVSENACMQYRFILNLGKLFITVYPANSIQSAVKEVESHIATSYPDFLCFCFSADELLLLYISDVVEQSFSISCGQLKVNSSSFSGPPSMKTSSKDFSCSVHGHKRGRSNDLKVILLCEPVQRFGQSETDKNDSGGYPKDARRLEDILGQMWLSWKRACLKFEESEIEYSENPCLLCEVKSFLTYRDLKNPDSGFLKCSLMLGKMNLDLDYSSILSMFLLLRQIQYVQCWMTDNGRARVFSHSPWAVEDQQGITCDEIYDFYASRMKMALCRMLPEKHIQLGIFIAGPHIQVSLRRGALSIENENQNSVIKSDDFHLRIDVHNIELVAWPTSKHELASSKGCLAYCDAEAECFGFQDLQIIDIPKSNNEKYASQGWISLCLYLRLDGFNVYVGDSMKNQQSQLFMLKPITLYFSSFREYVHSFSTAVTAISTALNGLALGFSVVSLMDELYIFFQVLGSFSALLHAFDSFDSVGYPLSQEFMRSDVVTVEHENKESSGEGASLICSRTLFSVNANFKLKSVDVVLHSCRANNKVESLMKSFDAVSNKQLAGYEFPDCGIWCSVLQTCIAISYEESKLDILLDLARIQAIIFRYEDPIPKCFDDSILRILLLQSHNHLYEVSLSKCTVTSWFGHPGDELSSGRVTYPSAGSILAGNTSYTVENSPTTNETEISNVQSHHFLQKLEFASNLPKLSQGHWLLMNLTLSEVFIVRCSMKKVLSESHQFVKLLTSLSIGGEFQTLSWGMQGGLLLLEPIALVMSIQCFSSYFNYVTTLSSLVQSSTKHIEKAEREIGMTGLDNNIIAEYAQETNSQSREVKWELPEAFSVDVSESSLVFVVGDESGGLWELVLEIDIHLDLELENMQRKFLFKVSRLSILSRILQENVETELKVPHFSSLTSKESSSHSVSGDLSVAFRHGNETGSIDDASCSSDVVSRKKSTVDNRVSKLFLLSHQNYILKHLGAFVSAKKLGHHPVRSKQAWVGSGSVSGFDVTVSLSELQMILSMVSSFSRLSSTETTIQSVQQNWSNSHETGKSFEAMVPNGAIVAIQDVRQHLYFTVEGGEYTYTLAGALHYSLVGERALFRVNYHKQRSWKSSVLWFSLISLYAKNNVGKPLRLNYCPGSGFVDISGTYDSASTLWRTLSCEPESSGGDAGWDTYSELVRHSFHLVNKKSDCGIAFIDGVPEFVRRPGNPFKLKVFHDLSIVHDVVTCTRYSLVPSATNVHPEAHTDEGGTSVQIGDLPCIDISIDEVAVTIVDELLDMKDRFPLLRGAISNTQLTVQILSTKARVISTLRASLNYFDAQRNLWTEFVHPVEVYTFYRSTFQTQDSSILHRMPVHMYCRTGKLEISLTELSLDILLFAIGKLGFAGPFSVRSSTVLANCCKVENKSGLQLVCHFSNKQQVTIERQQCASIFLRSSSTCLENPDSVSPRFKKLSWAISCG